MPKTKEKASDIKADIVEVESNELSAPSQEFVFDLEKMDIPYYSIKCSQSKYDAGEDGDVVHDKTYVVAKAETPTDISFLKFKQGWREKAPFGEERETVWTEKEAGELAARSPYCRKDLITELEEFALLWFAIEMPEDGDYQAFPHPIGDSMYCLGVMDVKNLGYKHTYKRLYTHWGLNANANLGAKKWSLVTRHHSGTKSDYWSPEIHISKGESSEEIQELAAKFNS